MLASFFLLCPHSLTPFDHPQNTDWVRVPKVYWQYTSPETLVLEYLPGTKINDGASLDRQGLDRKKLARLAVESYLQQM